MELEINEKKGLKFLKDVNAPIRPLTGYLRFLNDFREQARIDNPNISSRDILKIMGVQWNNLTSELKQKYHNESKLDLEKYLKDYEEYQKTDDYKSYQNTLMKFKQSRLKSIKEIKNINNIDESESSKFLNKKYSKVYKASKKSMQLSNNELLHQDLPIFTKEFMDYTNEREMEAERLRQTLKEKQYEIDNLSKLIEVYENDLANYSSEKAKNTVKASRLCREVDPFKARIVEAFLNCGVTNEIMLEFSEKHPDIAHMHLSTENMEEFLGKLAQIILNLDDNKKDKLDDINHLGDSDKINLKSVDKAISKIFDMEGLIGEKS
ncbi:high mobility group protein 20A-like [Gordionus sp. m RMFG-2023]|uniref:high mobility group protein 20A-like n=1 Tax=Gordionus sp. m RMFG-2023 TaxID=3053472 RepID=UPI0031FC9E7C